MAPGRMGPMRPAPMRPISFGPGSAPFARAPFRSSPFMSGRQFDGRFRHHRRFFAPPFGFFGSPFNYGYGYIPSFSEYPLFGPDSSSEQSYEAPPEAPPSSEDEGDALENQVQRLSDEIEQLRQERSAGPSSPVGAASAALREERLATVFVYRDGRKLEARNYAVMGKTLWLLGDQSTRRVPLSDLDLATSRKLNEERGSDFSLPGSN